jgi:hypothetical protein
MAWYLAHASVATLNKMVCVIRIPLRSTLVTLGVSDRRHRRSTFNVQCSEGRASKAARATGMLGRAHTRSVHVEVSQPLVGQHLVGQRSSSVGPHSVSPHSVGQTLGRSTLKLGRSTLRLGWSTLKLGHSVGPALDA